MLVETNICVRQILVATNMSLSRLTFCRDQHTFIATMQVFVATFVATKMILVAAPANDNSQHQIHTVGSHKLKLPKNIYYNVRGLSG